MKLISLCSGYGGLEQAVDILWKTELIAVADIDPGACKILAHRFPDVPNLGDLTKIDWSGHEADMITAGFPCQDVSSAGGRKGLRANTRTGVWYQVARAIDALQPQLVILENVRGLLSAGADSHVEQCPWCVGEGGDQHPLRALGAVLADLADLGFDAEWQVVPASAAGAPHKRERVFILAWPVHADGPRLEGLRGGSVTEPSRDQRPGRADRNPVRDAAGEPGDERGVAAPGQEAGGRARADAGGRGGAPAADPEGSTTRSARPASSQGGQSCGRTERHSNAPAADPEDRRRDERLDGGGERAAGARVALQGDDGGSHLPAADTESVALRGRSGLVGDAPAADGGRLRLAEERAAAGECGEGPAPDALGEPVRAGELAGAPRGTEGEGDQRERVRADDRDGDHRADWGRYAPAIARWEEVLGRPAPRPTQPGRTGQRLSPRFVEWMMGLPDGWVTDVPGLSRPQQLRALGNGVVPRQAALALRMLLAGDRGYLADGELLPTPNTMDSLPPKTPEQIMAHREDGKGGDFNLREVVLYEMEGRLTR